MKLCILIVVLAVTSACTMSSPTAPSIEQTLQNQKNAQSNIIWGETENKVEKNNIIWGE